MIEKGTAVDRIAADTDAGGDADTERLHLRAVRADDGRAPLFRIAPQIALDAHHILRRNAVGDNADQLESCIGGFHQRIGRVRRRHEHETGLGAGGLHCVFHRVEDRKIQMRLSAFSRRDAAHDLRTVFNHFLGVERRLAAGEALQDHPCRCIDENAHWRSPLRDTATTFCAASASVSAVMMGRPQSRTMRLPSSTLVPASRTTSGTRRPVAACTTPCATQSQRLMPAKMLTRIAFTFWSDSTRLNAAATRSGEAPPPTSRKLAGSPPACLIMSIVAIAKPAPLMMQPISPLKPT